MRKFYIKGLRFDGIDIIETEIEELIYRDEAYYTSDNILAFPNKPGLYKLDLQTLDLIKVNLAEDYLDFYSAYYMVGTKNLVKAFHIGFLMGACFTMHQQKELCLLN